MFDMYIIYLQSGHSKSNVILTILSGSGIVSPRKKELLLKISLCLGMRSPVKQGKRLSSLHNRLTTLIFYDTSYRKTHYTILMTLCRQTLNIVWSLSWFWNKYVFIIYIPKVFLMRKSWSTSDLPGHKARPVRSSANTQPIAQISTGGPYEVSPTSSSGARYHLVAT